MLDTLGVESAGTGLKVKSIRGKTMTKEEWASFGGFFLYIGRPRLCAGYVTARVLLIGELRQGRHNNLIKDAVTKGLFVGAIVIPHAEKHGDYQNTRYLRQLSTIPTTEYGQYGMGILQQVHRRSQRNGGRWEPNPIDVPSMIT